MQALLGPRRCGRRGRCAAAGAPSSAWTRLALASGRRDNPLERLDARTACRRRRVPQRYRSHRRVAGPQRCRQGRGGSAVQRPYVTLAAGGWGPRLRCSPAVGEERPRSGCSSAHAHWLCGGWGAGGRLGSAIRPLWPPWDPRFNLPGPVERRRGTASSAAAALVCARGGAFRPSLQAGLGCLKVTPALERTLGERTSFTSFIRSSFTKWNFLRERGL